MDVQLSSFLIHAVATVALEKTTIPVDENAGPVEVCANVTSPHISRPVAFSFNVTFSATDGTGTSRDMFASVMSCDYILPHQLIPMTMVTYLPP